MFRSKRIWAAAFLLGLAGALIDGFWLEPSSLALVEHDIPATGLASLRIAVIGDLHGGSRFIDTAKIARVAALANAAKPDLILLAGDYVSEDSHGDVRMPIGTIAPLLGKLHAPLGVHAVLGNHDRADDPAIAAALTQAGIEMLENRAARIVAHGRTFYLAGVGDFDSGADFPGRALATVPKGAGALCFTHSPDVFPELPRICRLTVAAHTHGGQVRLPLLGRLIVPSRYGQRYAAGLVREDGKTLFVTTGIGTSILAVRFLVPPEVSVLNVRS